MDRHLRIARLHAEDDVAEALVLADVEELERALHHAGGGVAVAVHDAVGERAVVGADAQGAPELLAASHQGSEAFGDPLDLFSVGGVRVFADLEAFLVREVSGIHPNLLHGFRGFHGGVGSEVDVGDEGNVHLATIELSTNVRECRGIVEGGRGDSNDLAAGVGQCLGLVGGGRHVLRIRGRHRLNPDRIRTADHAIPDRDFPGRFSTEGVGTRASRKGNRIGGSFGHGGEAEVLTTQRRFLGASRSRPRVSRRRGHLPERSPGGPRPCLRAPPQLRGSDPQRGAA